MVTPLLPTTSRPASLLLPAIWLHALVALSILAFFAGGDGSVMPGMLAGLAVILCCAVPAALAARPWLAGLGSLAALGAGTVVMWRVVLIGA